MSFLHYRPQAFCELLFIFFLSFLLWQNKGINNLPQFIPSLLCLGREWNDHRTRLYFQPFADCFYILLDADMLVIFTSVDNVCLNYGQPDEKPLSTMTVAEAKKYMEQGQFGEGDMLPKIEAAINFIGDSAIRSVLITKLNKDGSNIHGGMGTMITK
jgi:hypothetical protein